MFTATLLTISKLWKQPVNQLKNGLRWGMCIYIHIYKSEGKTEILYDFIHTWNLKIQTKLKRNKLIKRTDQWSLKRKGVGK